MHITNYSIWFSRLNYGRGESTLLESGKTPALLGRFNNFWGKIGKIFAKITKNCKIIVVFTFEDEMVYNFEDG